MPLQAQRTRKGPPDMALKQVSRNLRCMKILFFKQNFGFLIRVSVLLQQAVELPPPSLFPVLFGCYHVKTSQKKLENAEAKSTFLTVNIL